MKDFNLTTEDDPVYDDIKKRMRKSSDKLIRETLDNVSFNNDSHTAKIICKILTDELNRRKLTKQSDNWLDDVFGDEKD